jgi:hypothetical protein
VLIITIRGNKAIQFSLSLSSYSHTRLRKVQ